MSSQVGSSSSGANVSSPGTRRKQTSDQDEKGALNVKHARHSASPPSSGPAPIGSRENLHRVELGRFPLLSASPAQAGNGRLSDPPRGGSEADPPTDVGGYL